MLGSEIRNFNTPKKVVWPVASDTHIFTGWQMPLELYTNTTIIHMFCDLLNYSVRNITIPTLSFFKYKN